MKSIRPGLGLMLAMAISTAAQAAEHYTCQNEAGWGTWKLAVITAPDDPGTVKVYGVNYKGYSVVTKGFGEWDGWGSWDTVTRKSAMQFELPGGDKYGVYCNQDPVQQNRWNCADDETPPNSYVMVCYPW